MVSYRSVFIIGMSLIAAVEGVALYFGVNGVGLSASVGAIAMIAGYATGVVKARIKKEGANEPG